MSGGINPSSFFRSSHVSRDAKKTSWRICTNFASGIEIIKRFGRWPDHVLTPDTLEQLFKEAAKEPVPGFSIVQGGRVRPSFPFLTETEGGEIQRVFESRKADIYPEFRLALTGLSADDAGMLDRYLIVAQTLLVLFMRRKEQERGVWDERLPEQRSGTIFALGLDVPVTYTRVSSFVVGTSRRLSVPWGGAYDEYRKILPLFESHNTGSILRSADDSLHVATTGPDARALILLDLLIMASHLGSQKGLAELNLQAIEPEDVRAILPALAQGVDAVASATARALGAVMDAWRQGPYAYLEGPGDYLEMSYSVLAGLLFRWAKEDGLLNSTPVITYSGENVVVKKTLYDWVTFKRPDFPGLCVMKQPDSIWQALLGMAGDQPKNHV